MLTEGCYIVCWVKLGQNCDGLCLLLPLLVELMGSKFMLEECENKSFK